MMSIQEHPSGKGSEKKKGGNFFPALCNILGTVIILAVIAVCLPMAVPQLMGYQVYNVISGSMEPEIPVGSAVFVEPVEAVDIQTGDIIAFQSGDSVITHRVVENHIVEGEFVTKGDANAEADMSNTPYTALIGKVRWHVAMLGDFMTLMTSMAGKIYLLVFALCGFMFNLLASKLRARRREKLLMEEILKQKS
jgi:signal peptidase I